MAEKKRLLSGVKPTARPHIGNYFGAMRQFVDLQDSHDCLFMIADYHALNFIQNADEMRLNTIDLILSYIAIGLDPSKVILFKQSDVPAHTELAWIFDTITTMPYLQRAHAYKDAEAKNKEISVGTFNYPMLMAADILLYDTKIVPVGQDQKQHIEYARDTAEKFNRIFSEVFTIPDALILEDVAVVPGTDGQKMSKSYNNTIPLFGTKVEIEKAVMSIVTDSEGDRPEYVYAIHKLFKSETELKDFYSKNIGNYKAIKEVLIADIEEFTSPIRERRNSLTEADAQAVLKEGAEKARNIAEEKMLIVRKAIGVN
jgi:tryptophanyl-tRNA synthetase